MAFYVKHAVRELVDEIADADAITDLIPGMRAHFDQFAEDRKVADAQRVPANWGTILNGAGEYKKVARIPKPLWSKLCRMHDEGLCPDPLKDDAFFYGFLMAHPEYQAYTMTRGAK